VSKSETDTSVLELLDAAVDDLKEVLEGLVEAAQSSDHDDTALRIAAAAVVVNDFADDIRSHISLVKGEAP